MSTLDLKTGYHQIVVNPADRGKTAFLCSFDMFRYKRMPLDLRNAPATIQQFMDHFGNGHPTVNILVYLDDIFLLSETFEQHQALKLANPVERKNRDLKLRLAIIIGNNHTLWIEKLPAIRSALNTAKCKTADCTAAYLNFGRELSTSDDVTTDLRSVIHKENIEKNQDRRKAYADKSRKPSPNYKPDDLIWVKLHPLSKANQTKTEKFMPREDGPYIILSQKSPSSFVIASCRKPDEPSSVYHASALAPFRNVTQNLM
ncbi:Retrovirus-related Pol polyprotein like [Argiope bruennichi]|uniref:Retrovirus-related Pol polyprotein like n=1 Tax=Argiope bruennichi TaxID=94029 RepID=A0A8T0EUC0_ARGBR|nr:Retrovirus-related Pol polyprotein like [Argiope bruennichi]